MPGDILVLGKSTKKTKQNETEECPMALSTVYGDFPKGRRLMDYSCSRQQ